MFLRVDTQGLSGLGKTIAMRQPGGRVLKIRVPIIPKTRGMRGLGVTCPAGLVQTANGGCQDPALHKAGRNIPIATPKAVTYAQAPGCNVVDLTKNSCMLADGTIEGCNLIRECDPLTGNVHCQYGPYPGQVVQPNLPFCGSSGPVTSGPTSKPNPTGPSTPFVPQTTFASNSGVVLPATSAARIVPPASSPAASHPAASPSTPSTPQPNFFQQLFSTNPQSTATPASPVNLNITTTPGSGFDFSFLTNPVDVFGFEIPLWLIGVVVVGGGALLLGGKKR